MYVRFPNRVEQFDSRNLGARNVDSDSRRFRRPDDCYFEVPRGGALVLALISCGCAHTVSARYDIEALRALRTPPLVQVRFDWVQLWKVPVIPQPGTGLAFVPNTVPVGG